MLQASHVCLKDLSMVHGTHFYPLKEEVRSLLLFIYLSRKKRIDANINHSSWSQGFLLSLADFSMRRIFLDDELVILEFWDSPRHVRFRCLEEMHYSNVDAAIVVYDITQGDALDEAKSYVEYLQTKANPDIVVALVGNKADRSSQRVVNYKVICCCHCPH